MSRSGDTREHERDQQEPAVPQRGRTTGEGSGSALAAMLKKRREAGNQPDDGPEHTADGADPVSSALRPSQDGSR